MRFSVERCCPDCLVYRVSCRMLSKNFEDVVLWLQIEVRVSFTTIDLKSVC